MKDDYPDAIEREHLASVDAASRIIAQNPELFMSRSADLATNKLRAAKAVAELSILIANSLSKSAHMRR